MSNKQLANAKNNKNDEYYTRIEDIEREMIHFKDAFKNKVVYCNCDDPYESNFFKYFALNFNFLGLKKLICTSYITSPVAGTQVTFFDDEIYTEKRPYKVIIEEVNDVNGDGAYDLTDVELLIKYNEKNTIEMLEGDGDFRSEECIELLKEADIVCTNPPFSLLTAYFVQLFEYEKQFIILGNPNAIHYKEIFPKIKENKLWLGYKSISEDMLFNVSEKFAEELVKTKKEGSGYKIIDGEIKGRAQAIWYTNIDTSKRHEKYIFSTNTKKKKYIKYDNYDAINVDNVYDIPEDWFGLMGVPTSFLERCNPEQFEIVGVSDLPETMEGVQRLGEEWIAHYRSEGGTGHYTANMKSLGCVKNGKHKVIYSRLIIKRKQESQ